MVGGGPAPGYEAPNWHKYVGISLALLSSAFIGCSFVIKKKGLLKSGMGARPGEGHAYLKNWMWWTGMVMMLAGEILNLGAYSFSPAVLVTPLGALSVVISAALSSAILKEHLSFAAKVGCAHCVLGATILVLHAPASSSTTTMESFFDRVVNPGFLVYGGLNFLAVIFLIFYLSPRQGQKHPIIPIAICSLVGAFVVIATQGFGSAVVYSISTPSEPSQFREWKLWILLVFILGCGVLQINYLNKALNIFSTAIVTPIYYVCFTAATLIGSAILFRSFALANAVSAASVVLGFLVIVGGVCLLFAFSRQERLREKLQAEGSTHPDIDLVEAITTDHPDKPTSSLDAAPVPRQLHDPFRASASTTTTTSASLSSVVKPPLTNAILDGGGYDPAPFVADNGDIHIRSTGARPRVASSSASITTSTSSASSHNTTPSSSLPRLNATIPPRLSLKSDHSPWWATDRSADRL